MSRAMRDALVSPTAAPGQAARLKTLARRGIAATAAVLGSLIRVSTTEPVIALTFDDGPHPVDTPALLEVLARHRARATFFLVGKSAARHPELVARIVAEGHAVGGHTWDHPSLPTLPAGTGGGSSTGPGRRSAPPTHGCSGRRSGTRACARGWTPGGAA